MCVSEFAVARAAAFEELRNDLTTFNSSISCCSANHRNRKLEAQEAPIISSVITISPQIGSYNGWARIDKYNLTLLAAMVS